VIRALPEWQGKDDDTPIPPRVQQRVADRAGYRCENCHVRVPSGGEIDHTIALINGGGNRENNLRFLCRNCHQAKSRNDVAEKSKIAKTKRAMGPLKRVQSEWSKRYHAMKKWKQDREAD
jgi:5-methylcytosine-specific restriction protein A